MISTYNRYKIAAQAGPSSGRHHWLLRTVGYEKTTIVLRVGTLQEEYMLAALLASFVCRHFDPVESGFGIQRHGNNGSS